METTAINPLALAVIDIDPVVAEDIRSHFVQFLQQAEDWKQKAATLVVTDLSQTDEMKMAREARLALSKIRISADKTRKELKEDSLKYAKAVQNVYNVIENLITPIEKHLEDQEKFKERLEAQQRDQLRSEREALAKDLRQFIPYGIDLGLITDEDWKTLLNGAKLQVQAAAENAKKAEAERLELEKAAAAERERLSQENARLKAEADAREVEQRKANIEAARLRKEAEAAAAELQAIKDAEAKAAADKAAAEEAELSKGDKQKLVDLLSQLDTISKTAQFKSKKYQAIHKAVIELINKTIVYANSKI